MKLPVSLLGVIAFLAVTYLLLVQAVKSGSIGARFSLTVKALRLSVSTNFAASAQALVLC
jgi:hypothetical protein